MTMLTEEAYINTPWGIQQSLQNSVLNPGMRVKRNRNGGLVMAVQINGLVGPAIALDADDTRPFRQGRTAEMVVTELHGKFYEQTARQRTFTGNSASTGIAILVPATGGGHPTLWNPAGSGVNVSITRLELSYVSGNNAPGAFEWAITKNTGNTVGTGLPIATATLVAPEGGLAGNPGSAQARWSPTTNTFTAAPTFFRAIGWGLLTAVASTAADPLILDKVYDGDLVLAPGNAISLCFQTTTTTAVFQVSVTWEEVAV